MIVQYTYHLGLKTPKEYLMETPSASNQQQKSPRSEMSKEMLERIFMIAELIVNATKNTDENCPKVQSEGEKTQK